MAVGDTEGAAARDQVLRTRPMDLDPATRPRLQAAALMPAQVYNRAMKARVVLRQQFLAALHQVDVLVSPTSPYPPPHPRRPHRPLPEHRARADALLLPPLLQRQLLPGVPARHLHSRGLHQRPPPHRPPAGRRPLRRGYPAPNGPRLRASHPLAHHGPAPGPGIAP